MSSLAVGRRGLELEDLELWLAGLFSAAELAAADLLLQLSVSVSAKGVHDDDEEKAALSSSAATQSPSPRSATPGCDCDDLTVEEEAAKEEERVAEKPAASTELDRRPRKRYRRLSDLYAATSPVTVTSASATSVSKTKKRKRSLHRQDGFGSSSPSGSSVEPTRYGGDY
jgi:hypothetical protein